MIDSRPLPKRSCFALLALAAVFVAVQIRDIEAETVESPSHAKAVKSEMARFAIASYDQALKAYKNGLSGDIDQLYVWSCRCAKAEMESGSEADSVLDRHVDRMRELHDYISQLHENGSRKGSMKDATSYYFTAARDSKMTGKIE